MNSVNKLLHIKCCFFQFFNSPVALKNKKKFAPKEKLKWRPWLKYTSDNILDSRLRGFFLNPAWWFERIILEHILGIIAPEASILIQNAPKSLAAGAPPQTPLGELTAFPQTP